MTYDTTPGGASMIAERDKQALIPNSFPTPNAYIDRLMPLLTSDEFKVLMYAVRRIYGFQKWADRITARQFSEGIVTREGERLDYGTDLSEETCRKCIHNLEKFRVFIRSAENDPKLNQGAEYRLQRDASAIDWEVLNERMNQKHAAGKARMAKAKGGLPVAEEGVSQGGTTSATSRGVYQSHWGRGLLVAGGEGLLVPQGTQKPGKARESQTSGTDNSEGVQYSGGATPASRLTQPAAAAYSADPPAANDLTPTELKGCGEPRKFLPGEAFEEARRICYKGGKELWQPILGLQWDHLVRPLAEALAVYVEAGKVTCAADLPPVVEDALRYMAQHGRRFSPEVFRCSLKAVFEPTLEAKATPTTPAADPYQPRLSTFDPNKLQRAAPKPVTRPNRVSTSVSPYPASLA